MWNSRQWVAAMLLTLPVAALGGEQISAGAPNGGGAQAAGGGVSQQIADGLRPFLRENSGRSAIQPKNEVQNYLHILPLVVRPGVFPQGFFRISNDGDDDETITLRLSDNEGNVQWFVNIDTLAGQTRHVNSDDLAGWSDKWGIRTTYFGTDIRAEKTYAASAETSPGIIIRAFTRSRNGFINDVGISGAPVEDEDSGLTRTILGTANPGRNRDIVGILRYLNLERERELALDIWAFDDEANRTATVTCTIPPLGSITVEVADLEAGEDSRCSGMWGTGIGKWEVHSESDGKHLGMSFLLSVELGILANISYGNTARIPWD